MTYSSTLGGGRGKAKEFHAYAAEGGIVPNTTLFSDDPTRIPEPSSTRNSIVVCISTNLDPASSPAPPLTVLNLVTAESDTTLVRSTDLFGGDLLKWVVRPDGARYRECPSGRTVLTLGANMVRDRPCFSEGVLQ